MDESDDHSDEDIKLDPEETTSTKIGTFNILLSTRDLRRWPQDVPLLFSQGAYQLTTGKPTSVTSWDAGLSALIRYGSRFIDIEADKITHPQFYRTQRRHSPQPQSYGPM